MDKQNGIKQITRLIENMKNNILRKKFIESIIDIIKYIGLIYILIFVPSIIFGIRFGVVITFFIIVIYIFYKTNEKYYEKREKYLKDLLLNDG